MHRVVLALVVSRAFSGAPNLCFMLPHRRAGPNREPTVVAGRLWIDADFEECYVLESDATYSSGL